MTDDVLEAVPVPTTTKVWACRASKAERRKERKIKILFMVWGFLLRIRRAYALVVELHEVREAGFQQAALLGRGGVAQFVFKLCDAGGRLPGREVAPGFGPLKVFQSGQPADFFFSVAQGAGQREGESNGKDECVNGIWGFEGIAK